MKNIVIVDIDGTISKVGERLKYLQMEPPDWDKFYEDCFEDEPHKDIIRLVQDLNIFIDYEIHFCTGRRESVRNETQKWIDNTFHELFDYKSIMMRPDGDNRHDIEVKPELLSKASIPLDRIAFVLEDRNSMVKKWREMGLRVLQVAEGDF